MNAKILTEGFVALNNISFRIEQNINALIKPGEILHNFVNLQSGSGSTGV